MPKAIHTPVYQLLIRHLKNGFKALDDEVQQEIIGFIKKSQSDSGAFVDRAGFPDLYYSLFGFWLSKASGQNELLSGLGKFAEVQDRNILGAVEELALVLIQAGIDPAAGEKPVLSILYDFLRKGKNIGFSYRIFLLTLVVDAIGKNKRGYYFVAQIWLFLYRPKTGFPCSLMAALVYARKTLGLKTEKWRESLLKFYAESGGFRAFEHIKTGDMLSTGVALFVLRETGYDMRMMKPALLDFIQQNYSDGAFLSGDGDFTRDLEYTFYGLLALGSLAGADE